MSYKIGRQALILTLLILLAFSGCQRGWSFSVSGLPTGSETVSYQTWQEYALFAEENSIPVEQIVYGLGARVLDSAMLVDQDGLGKEYPWDQLADHFVLEKNGAIDTDHQALKPASILLFPSEWEKRVEGHIYDIAPTAAAALGIPAPALSTGEDLGGEPADAVLLLFLDGFGYIRYQEALEEGLIPALSQLDPPRVGLTTYPPVTTVSSASLLTGTEPSRHGVDTRGIRTTDNETLFDVAQEAGLRVVAVEGEALAFNLRSAELELSGDRDGNGGTDDNVLANTLAVLEGGMPDLLFVHFHGIDDQGHEVGPGAPAEREKISEVDAAVGKILEVLPTGTEVIIFADHGMHLVDEDGRSGNHGHLIPRDMLIPIWVFKK